MNIQVELPDYKKKNYLQGDYSGFKYHTELLKERERVCFLSGRQRSAEGSSRLETEVKRDNDPRVGPGFYTPLPPSFRATLLRPKRPAPVLTRGKESDSSESLLALETKGDAARNRHSSADKRKRSKGKEGLLWGGRRDRGGRAGDDTPGPADSTLPRYPECLGVRPNLAPFNVSSVYKQPLTITPVAPKSSSDQFTRRELFKCGFESRKELNVPVVICARPYRDPCVRCRAEIDEGYFYVRGDVFICCKCYKEAAQKGRALERIKLTMFKQGRYCTRYHKHHKVRGFDKLIPSKTMFKLFLREVYHQQYTGGRLVNEGVPPKNKAKAGAEASKIYQSLFPQGAYNKQELCNTPASVRPVREVFEHTLGMVREWEPVSGVRQRCLVCRPTPTFILPTSCSHRSVLGLA